MIVQESKKNNDEAVCLWTRLMFSIVIIENFLYQKQYQWLYSDAYILIITSVRIYSYVQFLRRNPRFVSESTRNLQLQETVPSNIILSITNLIICTYVYISIEQNGASSVIVKVL